MSLQGYEIPSSYHADPHRLNLNSEFVRLYLFFQILTREVTPFRPAEGGASHSPQPLSTWAQSVYERWHDRPWPPVQLQGPSSTTKNSSTQSSQYFHELELLIPTQLMTSSSKVTVDLVKQFSPSSPVLHHLHHRPSLALCNSGPKDFSVTMTSLSLSCCN